MELHSLCVNPRPGGSLCRRAIQAATAVAFLVFPQLAFTQTLPATGINGGCFYCVTGTGGGDFLNFAYNATGAPMPPQPPGVPSLPLTYHVSLRAQRRAQQIPEDTRIIVTPPNLVFPALPLVAVPTEDANSPNFPYIETWDCRVTPAVHYTQRLDLGSANTNSGPFDILDVPSLQTMFVSAVRPGNPVTVVIQAVNYASPGVIPRLSAPLAIVDAPSVKVTSLAFDANLQTLIIPTATAVTIANLTRTLVLTNGVLVPLSSLSLVASFSISGTFPGFIVGTNAANLPILSNASPHFGKSVYVVGLQDGAGASGASYMAFEPTAAGSVLPTNPQFGLPGVFDGPLLGTLIRRTFSPGFNDPGVSYPPTGIDVATFHMADLNAPPQAPPAGGAIAMLTFNTLAASPPVSFAGEVLTPESLPWGDPEPSRVTSSYGDPVYSNVVQKVATGAMTVYATGAGYRNGLLTSAFSPQFTVPTYREIDHPYSLDFIDTNPTLTTPCELALSCGNGGSGLLGPKVVATLWRVPSPPFPSASPPIVGLPSPTLLVANAPVCTLPTIMQATPVFAPVTPAIFADAIPRSLSGLRGPWAPPANSGTPLPFFGPPQPIFGLPIPPASAFSPTNLPGQGWSFPAAAGPLVCDSRVAACAASYVGVGGAPNPWFCWTEIVPFLNTLVSPPVTIPLQVTQGFDLATGLTGFVVESGFVVSELVAW